LSISKYEEYVCVVIGFSAPRSREPCGGQRCL